MAAGGAASSAAVSRFGASQTAGVAAQSAATPETFACDSLTVAVYGGSFGDAVRAGSITPLQETYGVSVLEDQGASTVTLGKLREQQGNPTIDIAWMDGGVSEIAQAEGLVDTIDLAALAHVNDLFPEAIHRDQDGNVFALTGGFYAIGMAYNTDTIETPPVSWKDLWKPEYAGRVTTASPANATWPNWFAHMAGVYGGNLDNVDPFIDAMADLDVVAFWDAAGQADNLYQSGEAHVGVHVAGSVWALADKGLPMAYVVPTEGAVAGDVRAHIVKGTKCKDLAMKSLELMISPEGQRAMVDVLYLAPANTTTEISEQARERMPYGAEGTMEDLIIPDWFAINERKQQWIDLWNREVLG